MDEYSELLNFKSDEARVITLVCAFIAFALCVCVTGKYVSEHFTPEAVRIEQEKTKRTDKVLWRIQNMSRDLQGRALEALTRADLIGEEVKPDPEPKPEIQIDGR